MLQGREVFISGGGVAGFAAALALARRGARVTLAEQSQALSTSGGMGGQGVWQGGGLQVSPNGSRVLVALGLGETLRRASLEAQAVVLHDGFTGHRLTRLVLPRGPQGTDYRLFRRAELVAMLAEGARAAGIEILPATRVEWLAESPGGVRLRMGGEEREVALALAADGIHSGARPLLNGPGAPFFTGQVAWRAIIEDEGPPETRAFLGPGMHLVSYPLTHGGRNLVAVMERSRWAEEGWDHPDDPANLQRQFSTFAPEVRGWLSRVTEVRLWGLFRHPIAPRWHGARLALLGDAAHPTLPFMAQGANMALEDAWLLAEGLATLPPDQALPRWQALRVPRVARAIAAANANARNYHLRGLSRYAAHRALWLGSLVAPNAALARFRWLYDHDITAERF